MNAVNLLPAQYRSRRMSAPASTPFLALAAGLLVVLLATVMFVSSDNQVHSRRAQLAQLDASASRWVGLSSHYSGFSAEVQQHTAEEANVTQLATNRFDWSELLGQVAALMPADAKLSSLQATSPLSSSTAGTSAGISTSATSSSGSAIQVSACATSQDAVAQTMVQLHAISGIKSVTLSSSTNSSAGNSVGGASSSASVGCSLPVQFDLTLAFASSAGASSAAASGTSTSPSSAVSSSTTSTTESAQ